MKKIYYYKTCYICKKKKPSTRSSYCKNCIGNKRREKVEYIKDVNIDICGLEKFLNRVKRNSYFIDFNDINTIIFFYELITSDINEYDRYKSGKQIQLMWNRIMFFYNNKKKK